MDKNKKSVWGLGMAWGPVVPWLGQLLRQMIPTSMESGVPISGLQFSDDDVVPFTAKEFDAALSDHLFFDTICENQWEWVPGSKAEENGTDPQEIERWMNEHPEAGFGPWIEFRLSAAYSLESPDEIRKHYADPEAVREENGMLLARLSQAYRAWYDTTIDLASAKLNNSRTLAVSRILKAAAVAYRRGDDKTLVELEDIARPYLRRTCKDAESPETIAKDVMLKRWETDLKHKVETVDLGNGEERRRAAERMAQAFIQSFSDPLWMYWLGPIRRDLDTDISSPAKTAEVAHVIEAALKDVPSNSAAVERLTDVALSLTKSILKVLGYDKRRANSAYDYRRKATHGRKSSD